MTTVTGPQPKCRKEALLEHLRVVVDGEEPGIACDLVDVFSRSCSEDEILLMLQDKVVLKDRLAAVKVLFDRSVLHVCGYMFHLQWTNNLV